MILKKTEQIFHLGVPPVRVQFSWPERCIGPVCFGLGYLAWPPSAAPQGLRSLIALPSTWTFWITQGNSNVTTCWCSGVHRVFKRITYLLHMKAWNFLCMNVNKLSTISDLEIIVVISLQNPTVTAVQSLTDYFHDQQIQPSPNKAYT